MVVMGKGEREFHYRNGCNQIDWDQETLIISMSTFGDKINALPIGTERLFVCAQCSFACRIIDQHSVRLGKANDCCRRRCWEQANKIGQA